MAQHVACGILVCLLAIGPGACSDDSGSSPPDKGPDLGAPDAARDATSGLEAGPDLPGSDFIWPDLPVTDHLVTHDSPPAPANSKCSTPQALSLTGASVTVSGDTTGAYNEFSASIACGGYTSYDGPQLYYKVNLTGGKVYKVTLTPTYWDAGLYALPAATACTATAVDTACAGHEQDNGGAGDLEALILKPTTTADWLIVVDSHDSSDFGAFTLTVEEGTMPTNTACSTAKALTLSSGKVTVTGDTSYSSPEFGGDVDCGGYTTYDGPQLYYKVGLTAGKVYKVTLAPTGWDAGVYAFPAGTSCSGTAIDAACTGYAKDYGSSGDSEILALKPTTSADWIIVADSYGTTAYGSFTLTIEEGTASSHAACSAAQALTLTSGTGTATGDTTFATNEFGTAVTCGGYSGYSGPQLYYKVSLVGGKTYEVTLTPSDSWDPALYAFAASTGCTSTAIDTACTGHDSDSGSTGDAETITLAPSTSTDWILAADSWDADEYGAFTLKVTQQP